jgi:hypothetical protein
MILKLFGRLDTSLEKSLIGVWTFVSWAILLIRDEADVVSINTFFNPKITRRWKLCET